MYMCVWGGVSVRARVYVWERLTQDTHTRTTRSRSLAHSPNTHTHPGAFCAVAVGATFPSFVIMIGGVLDHLAPFFDQFKPLSDVDVVALIKQTFGEFAKNAIPYIVEYVRVGVCGGVCACVCVCVCVCVAVCACVYVCVRVCGWVGGWVGVRACGWVVGWMLVRVCAHSS